MNIIGELLGNRILFNCSNYPEHRVRHRNSELWADKEENEEQFELDSLFDVVPGLGGGISFASMNYPGRYIRHRDSKLFLDPLEDSDAFRMDASWQPHRGLWDKKNDYSFESLHPKFRGFFIRHSRSRLRIDQRVGDDLFRKDATWIIKNKGKAEAHSNWVRIYGDDHKAGGHWIWKQTYVRGITVGGSETIKDSFSTSLKMALESSGGVSVPLEGVDISASIKAMFERAMSVTLEHTTEKAWKKGETLTTERIFEGEEGQGLYIWQEQLQGRASTGGGVQVFLENFKETQTDTQPE